MMKKERNAVYYIMVIFQLLILTFYFSCGKDKETAPESIDMEMVYIAEGTFQMGSEEGRGDERPAHTVILNSFSIGKYEVTNSQYCENSTHPSYP